MFVVQLKLLVSILTMCVFISVPINASAQVQVSEQKAVLSALDRSELKNFNAPYVFRIASFSKEEGGYGSGALVLLMSKDTKTAIVNVNGVRTELRAMQAVAMLDCQTGSTRQQVYAKDQLRLMVKLTLKAGEEACWAEGLVSIRTDKHTNRYMVKGVSGL
ncbi:hypothetical protein [Undibacterium flavidum]|uniref:Uncharacterized protein n=1 Tax=Undibacterium flavidum TaxID=2762297 RepID=A0ABR6YBX7_9BURK|nr:hypothetical protein [Undibacterium flavidum]MBC3873817.1 hypothetical protein [Undibacterium flavidum]